MLLTFNESNLFLDVANQKIADLDFHRWIQGNIGIHRASMDIRELAEDRDPRGQDILKTYIKGVRQRKHDDG